MLSVLLAADTMLQEVHMVRGFFEGAAGHTDKCHVSAHSKLVKQPIHKHKCLQVCSAAGAADTSVLL